MHCLLRITTRSGRLLADALLAVGLLWALGLLVYQPLCLLPVAAMAGLALWLWRRCPGSTLPLRAWLWVLFLLCVCLYQLLPVPRGPWQQPWEHQATCKLDGALLTVEGMRDFRYRTEDDYTPRYTTRTFDLTRLRGVDFAECRWDGHTAICHTMVSFSFADGSHLVVSPETRLPRGTAQSALGGLYKKYALTYVIGTEDDIFALRTNYRHEDLYLYPLDITPEQALALLVSTLDLAMDANSAPSAYNVFTANCSTGFISLLHRFLPGLQGHYPGLPVHNSLIVDILYNHHCLQTRPGESLPQLRKRAATGYDIPARNYSAFLRARLEK